jgi:hypothetical protein
MQDRTFLDILYESECLFYLFWILQISVFCAGIIGQMYQMTMTNFQRVP